ncbi:ABC transporter ATP-binding protein [Brachybacterium sp. AOP25-B2-12]|uniref:ABC transporter ATP-binding protein n=1 Tax=Brachybacterium sp. AOP25-B2-12 TaxID=3457710 RepID=UPI0040339436
MTTPASSATVAEDRATGQAPVIALDRVRVSFGATRALDDVSLRVEPGERVAVMGPSGCGKSTLLHTMAGVLTPESGTVRFGGQDLAGLSGRARSRLRLGEIGMVFQFGDLIGELTLRENVELPLRLLRCPRDERETRVDALLERLGIREVAGRRAAEVSGGQAQRAAVARALVTEPALLLADEPTGALDSVSSDLVMELLTEAAGDLGATLVVVTHENGVAAYLDRLVTLRDGTVVTSDA